VYQQQQILELTSTMVVALSDNVLFFMITMKAHVAAVLDAALIPAISVIIPPVGEDFCPLLSLPVVL
jgi:hypothetical protein